MLKTESIGWSLEDQLGEVLEVSHHNHVIVEKYLRVRVKILLHEPLKCSIEITPLGSSKIFKYDVKYEKLPLYCECCGIVGHTSERFCKIPREERVVCFPRNLSVEPYWKSQGASRRGLLFGNYVRGGNNSTTGIVNNNIAKATDVVKVATAVSRFTVSEKGGAISVKMNTSQEGRTQGIMAPTPAGAPLGQEDQAGALADPGGRGQEVQGRVTMLESRQNAEVDQSQLCYGVVHAQSTHAGHLAVISHAQVKSRKTPPHGDEAGELLFQPGVLEALSGAVAARLTTKNTTDTPIYTFNATKKSMQGKTKEKGRKGKKGGGIGSSEGARKNIIGKKRSLYEAPATGSELDFSFEKTMDSYERILYGDINISSKRVCMGRVEAVRDGNGVVTHVSKEVEEKEEAPGQQRRESVGDDGASAASEEEVRRAK